LLFSGDETFNVNLNHILAPSSEDKAQMTEKVNKYAGRKQLDLASLS